MRKARVLFVTEEISPYMVESHISEIGRHLPQGIQERCMERLNEAFLIGFGFNQIKLSCISNYFHNFPIIPKVTISQFRIFVNGAK